MDYRSYKTAGRFSLPKTGLVLTLALSLVLGLLPATPARAADGAMVRLENGDMAAMYQEYVALVIGVENYQNWPRLTGAMDNARRVAQALRDLGFKTTIKLNPTAAQLRHMLSYMPEGLGANQRTGLLIYFVGHGVFKDMADGSRLGFLVPADGPPKDASPERFSQMALSTYDLENMAFRVKSNHVLTVIDSQFEDSVFNLSIPSPKPLLPEITSRSRQFIRSGTAPSGPQGRDAFTNIFISGLRGEADLNRDAYLTGTELASYLRYEAAQQSNPALEPLYGTLNTQTWSKGDFVIALPADASLATPKRRVHQAGSAKVNKPGSDAAPQENFKPRAQLRKRTATPLGHPRILIAPSMVEITAVWGETEEEVRGVAEQALFNHIDNQTGIESYAVKDSSLNKELYERIWGKPDFTAKGYARPKKQTLAKVADDYGVDVVTAFYIRPTTDSGYGDGQLSDVYMFLYCYLKHEDRLYGFYNEVKEFTLTPQALAGQAAALGGNLIPLLTR